MTDAADEPDEAERPRKKKKKRKKKAPELRTLDAAGAERPRFLLSFPKHPELDALVAAYEAGDFARVRSEAPKLAEQSDDPDVRDAALELRRRIDPDPLIRYLLLAAMGLLAFLVLYAYTHKN